MSVFIITSLYTHTLSLEAGNKGSKNYFFVFHPIRERKEEEGRTNLHYKKSNIFE